MPPNGQISEQLPVAPLKQARDAITAWQSRLLDLSKGNRLLRFRASKLSTVPLESPDPVTLFSRLVLQDRSVPIESFPQPPTAEIVNSEGSVVPADQPRPSILSPYPLEQLQNALYNLRLKAKASLEERGVNVLHVAFGFLVWDDHLEKALTWRAPIVLAPVRIERPAPDKHTLAPLEEDIVLNPTLAHKLKTDYGIELPDLPDDLDEFQIDSYWKSIQEAVQPISGAHVDVKVYLGLFSFLKIPMYQDLARYSELILSNPLVGQLAGAPPVTSEQPLDLPSGDELDKYIDLHATFQVLDADSSQQEALLAARQGAHLLIQGPPGTGKSQTITNLIAESLAAGKRILFVSEKAAALEVVKRNLDKCGLGDGCLELHSYRADKKQVLAELDRVLNAPALDTPAQSKTKLESLKRLRDELNGYVRELHAVRFALNRTAFQGHGLLASIRDAPPLHFGFADVTLVTEQALDRCEVRLEAMQTHAEVIGRLADHPWKGLSSRAPSFAYAGELSSHLSLLRNAEQELEANVASLRSRSGLNWPRALEEILTLLQLLSKYRIEVLSLPGAEWRERFTLAYRGWSRLLSLDYWNDSNKVRAFCRQGWEWNYPRICSDLAALEQAQAVLGSRDSIPDDSLVRPSLENQQLVVLRLQAEFDFFQKQFDGGAYDAAILQRTPQAAIEWCDAHLSSLDHVDDYLRYLHDRELAAAEGLQSFIDAASAAKIPVEQWHRTFLAGFYRAWLDEAGRRAPELGYFSRFDHEKRIEQFRQLDVELLRVAAQVVAARVAAKRPQITERVQRAASAEISILARELHKQRRIKPLRKLFSQAPEVIQALKPCFMMSPLAVSQYLVPERFHFDIVIFDEASQVKVEDAVGCIFRGKQLVVAGDSKQLPPTRFFDVLTSDDEWDEEDEQEADVYESILDALGTMPDSVLSKMLLWHYRSRHEELIAFSNKNFYDNHLYTFPDPGQAGEKKPINFVFVPEGVYERGGARKNMIEARRVVDLVLDHFRQSSHWSLAVVTFSDAQRDAIQQEIDRRIAQQPDLRRFFEENGYEESFRIKNLELVQGDERDVILFSIGYGRDESGNPPPMNFGPLNKAGGRRRLNVAVTRARQHVTVVSSIQPEELEKSNNEGVRLLKEYMLLARDGLDALFKSEPFGERDSTESPFEESVCSRLAAEGLTILRQVGCSGYRIDLAVVDPKTPGRYCLGIECDGAMYHSARTARDRDRLREQILVSLGWHIHRIWSRDWNANPDREVNRILELVARYAGEQCASMPTVHAALETRPAKTPEEQPAAPPAEAPVQSLPGGTVYYEEFNGPFASRPENPRTVADDIAQIVACQGPTAVVVVNDMFASAWHAERSRTRVRSTIRQALELGVRQGLFRLSVDRAFVWPRAAESVQVRVPHPEHEPRPLDEICPEEIAAAVRLCLFESGGGASDADLVRLVVRLYGHTRAVQRVAEPVRAVLEDMLKSGQLGIVDGTVRAP